MSENLQAKRGLPLNTLTLGSGPVDIGQCAGLKVTCVSETGWWDNAKVLAPMMAAGGPLHADQWQVGWDPTNAAGAATLIEMEGLDGQTRRLLLDAGWNPAYMAWRLQAIGLDQRLTQGQVDALLFSHEHMDHFWGLEAVLDLDPTIPLLLPSGFSMQALAFIYGATLPRCGAANKRPYQGQPRRMEPDRVHNLFPGAASITFDLPIMLGVRSEQALIFNLQDRGLVLVTGCSHMGITTLIDFARRNIAHGDKIFGIYGGLHLAPFGQLEPEQAAVVDSLGDYGLTKLACNHCTGESAVQRMLENGLPVVRGSGTQGSKSALFIGNGDSVEFI